MNIFKARKSRSFKQKAHYLYLRFKRLRDNPHQVALGVAISLFINWLPILGFHTILIILLCWMFRANILAGLLASFLGNPWTLPAMFWLDYEVGLRLMNAFDFTFKGFLPDFLDQIIPIHIVHWAEKMFLTALLGSLPIATLTGVASYFITYSFVHNSRKLLIKKDNPNNV